MKAYHPQKVTYEVTSEMREYLELTWALWRASKVCVFRSHAYTSHHRLTMLGLQELSAGFPGELIREMLWNGTSGFV